ncbi:MAG TPA: PKD domain-containing protein, partial [Candidatus Thalassarchaeaceae archaeon]|nr:PKD domain-containing protein [Candidatus Thalassarchaeaceae archaeon]
GEVLWSFEHSGFVTQMFSLDDGIVVVIGESPEGSNPAPVVLLDPDSIPHLPEDAKFDFEEIRRASSDFAGDLSQEEIALADAPPMAISETDDLMNALEEDLEIITEEPVVEVDLLEDLSSSARAINLPPIADAGEDRTVSADEDNTAIVLLDGSSSYDPDGTIESWAWQNEMDKVIGHTPQIKVKLLSGVHTFKLQVTDNRGASTTSMVTIRIQ